MTIKDYYCSLKFRFQKIDLASKTTYVCHAARPHDIDFNWLETNPGQSFNTPLLIEERKMMLNNQRDNSCDVNCWSAEDLGATSPRLFQQCDGSLLRTHTDLINRPEIIDITVGDHCNMTCSYCCKEYSTSWKRDIANNGDYKITNGDLRYRLSDKDKILLKISQPELKTTRHYQMMLNEIRLAAPTAKRLDITGGEPFLDNGLIDLLEELELPKDAIINLYSGLGVSLSRFESIIKKLKGKPNLRIWVSAETTEKFYEFNRYGNTWSDFLKKIQIIKDHGIEIVFSVVISNLTVQNFLQFYKQYSQDHKLTVTYCYTPSMMSPYVLDPVTKQRILEEINVLPEDLRNEFEKSLSPEPTDLQRKNIGEFLQEFVKRRSDLSLNIFPNEFLTWAGINHVV
jgi:organic radical activating enzyme